MIEAAFEERIMFTFSFYMYCISKMERHTDITKEYDDREYLLKAFMLGK